MAAGGKIKFNLIPFAFRQFDDPSYTGSKFSCTKEFFVQKLNELYKEKEEREEEEGYELKEGYAPFCKHLFVPNFTEARVPVLAIDQHNCHLLKSGYHARTPKELPVLERYFPRDSLPQEAIVRATWLDIILYSKEQIDLENKAMGETFDVDAPWGIVSIKAQDVPRELPMNPITIMRNSLGKEEGGSGVAIDREKYAESVAYWETHANIK